MNQLHMRNEFGPRLKIVFAKLTLVSADFVAISYVAFKAAVRRIFFCASLIVALKLFSCINK